MSHSMMLCADLRQFGTLRPSAVLCADLRRLWHTKSQRTRSSAVMYADLRRFWYTEAQRTVLHRA